MSKIKVTYFETTGVVEMIRLLLSYGKQPFEDIRVPLDNWRAMQKNFFFERLPVVEIDGEEFHQSLAVARYLAKQYKLAGESDKENMQIDAIVDTINDMRVQFTNCLWDQDAVQKKKKAEELHNKIIPFFFPKFETLLKQNNGYLYNGKLTWADFMFVGIVPYLNVCCGKDVLEYSSTIKEYVEKFYSLPNVKEYVEKRPQKCCIKELLSISKDGVIIKD